MSGPTRQDGRPRRRYDGSRRRRMAAETRDRIVAAGADILHGFPVWNWRALTVRAVAERAGVNERTVYRHFGSEQGLRDAVLARLEQEADVDLDGLGLGDLVEVTTRILTYVASFPLGRPTPDDPTLRAASRRQREALVGAVAPVTGSWTAAERATAAAVLDVLWSVSSYERLVAEWELSPAEAIAGITWVMGLVEDAVRRGDRPGAIVRTGPTSPAGDPPGGPRGRRG